MSGPDDNSNASPDRPIQSIDPNSILKARRLSRTFREIILLDSAYIDLRGGSPKFEFPLVGSCTVRSYQSDNACVGLRYHLGSTENDHATQPGSQTGRQPDDDVVADATNDRLFLIHATQWSGSLLDDLQYLGNRDSVFCERWMGPIIPAISQSHTTGCTSRKQAAQRNPRGGV